MFKKIILIVLFIGSLYASIEDEVDAKRFEHKNGTLIDHFSGMQWQDNTNMYIGHKWGKCVNYCKNLTLDSYDDWRLPTRAELEYTYSIRKKPNFLNTGVKYWTELEGPSGCCGIRNTAYFIDFKTFKYRDWDKEAVPNAYALCIRGNQFNNLSTLDTHVNEIRDTAIEKETNKRAKLEFSKIKNSNDSKINIAFTKKYPTSEEAKIVIKKMYQLVKDKNNIAGYEWFIKTYPKAPQVKEAIAKIHQLAFDEAEDIDTISAYNTFIISYPMAQEVKEANALAKELESYKYTDTLPSWFRSIMPDFLADIFNGIFGIFSSDEKKSRALLIKAKQIERQGNEYYGVKKAGYVMITNRMYDLLQEEYDDTDATLRFLESEEFKDFVKTFKSVMRSMNDRLSDISRYSSQILEVSKQGFSEANADRDMSEYKNEEQRKWQKFMHLRDKGYN